MCLRDRLQDRLRSAVRAQDRDTVKLCRTVLAAIANAEAVPVEHGPRAGAVEVSAVGVGAAEVDRRTLDDVTIRSVVQDEIEERRQAAAVPGIPEHTRDRLIADADYLTDLLSSA